MEGHALKSGRIAPNDDAAASVSCRRDQHDVAKSFGRVVAVVTQIAAGRVLTLAIVGKGIAPREQRPRRTRQLE